MLGPLPDADYRRGYLTLRPGVSVFKEPYLTLVGPAGWGNPVPNRGQAGYGIAGAIPVETMDEMLVLILVWLLEKRKYILAQMKSVTVWTMIVMVL